MKRILLASLLAFCLSPAARADDPKPVTVPFEILKSGHMAVSIKVEGKCGEVLSELTVHS